MIILLLKKSSGIDTPGFFCLIIISMNRTLKYDISTEYDGFQIDKYLKTQGYSSANITAIKKMPNNVVING